jgi:hypothetical protein
VFVILSLKWSKTRWMVVLVEGEGISREVALSRRSGMGVEEDVRMISGAEIRDGGTLVFPQGPFPPPKFPPPYVIFPAHPPYLLNGPELGKM